MGEKINRIEKEFVLKSLAEKGLPLTLRCRSDRVDARVVEVGERSLSVKPALAVGWRAGDPAEVFFLFQNNNHTFTTRISGIEEDRLRIEMPDSIYKSLQRQFDRVRRPQGFEVSFRLAGVGAIDLTFPLSGPAGAGPGGEAGGGAAPDAGPAADAAFDPATIKGLVEEFNKRARAEASDGRIVMMRNRVAATYEERIMQATGKALWIPSTEEDFPSRDPLAEPGVLTKAEIVQYEKAAGADQTLIVSRVADILYRKRREGIESELYWPLLHGRYFVGYLHMVTNAGRKRIARPLLEWVSQFARVLGFSLEHGGYFKGEAAQVRPYQAEAVDLSPAGLLFAHPEKDLYKKLLVHSDIQVALNARNRRMTIGGRVVRKFMDRDRVYIALRFLEITPEDFRYLHETLYGREFDPETALSEAMTRPGLTGLSDG